MVGTNVPMPLKKCGTKLRFYYFDTAGTFMTLPPFRIATGQYIFRKSNEKMLNTYKLQNKCQVNISIYSIKRRPNFSSQSIEYKRGLLIKYVFTLYDP